MLRSKRKVRPVPDIVSAEQEIKVTSAVVVEKYAQSLIEPREEALTQSREIGRWGSSSRRLLGKGATGTES